MSRSFRAEASASNRTNETALGPTARSAMRLAASEADPVARTGCVTAEGDGASDEIDYPFRAEEATMREGYQGCAAPSRRADSAGTVPSNPCPPNRSHRLLLSPTSGKVHAAAPRPHRRRHRQGLAEILGQVLRLLIGRSSCCRR